jgi:hypothetical protein
MSLQLDGLSHERKNSMPAIAVSIEVVTTVLLVIRIGSRFTTRTRFGLDDALITAAWFLGIGLTVSVLLGEPSIFNPLNQEAHDHRRNGKIRAQQAHMGCPA